MSSLLSFSGSEKRKKGKSRQRRKRRKHFFSRAGAIKRSFLFFFFSHTRIPSSPRAESVCWRLVRSEQTCLPLSARCRRMNAPTVRARERERQRERKGAIDYFRLAAEKKTCIAKKKQETIAQTIIIDQSDESSSCWVAHYIECMRRGTVSMKKQDTFSRCRRRRCCRSHLSPIDQSIVLNTKLKQVRPPRTSSARGPRTRTMTSSSCRASSALARTR